MAGGWVIPVIISNDYGPALRSPRQFHTSKDENELPCFAKKSYLLRARAKYAIAGRLKTNPTPQIHQASPHQIHQLLDSISESTAICCANVVPMSWPPFSAFVVSAFDVFSDIHIISILSCLLTTIAKFRLIVSGGVQDDPPKYVYKICKKSTNAILSAIGLRVMETVGLGPAFLLLIHLFRHKFFANANIPNICVF